MPWLAPPITRIVRDANPGAAEAALGPSLFQNINRTISSMNFIRSSWAPPGPSWRRRSALFIEWANTQPHISNLLIHRALMLHNQRLGQPTALPLNLFHGVCKRKHVVMIVPDLQVLIEHRKMFT